MRLKPGDMVTVRRELGTEMSVWETHPLADDMPPVGTLVYPNVALVIMTSLSDLNTPVVYLVCPDCMGWALVANLRKVA